MDILELIIKIATPLVIAYFGFLINKNLAEQRSKLTISEKLIEKRISIYDDISSELNVIYQYMVRVGNWKEMSPEEVIAKKRTLDKLVHQNRPYWSIDFIDTYSNFIFECFKTNTGTGEDAKIKADTVKYSTLDSWEPEYEAMFIGEKTDKSKVRDLYNAFNEAVSRDINPQG